MSVPMNPDDPKPEAVERDEPGPVRPRKPYEPPELVEYGSVAKLTQGTSSPVSDGGPIASRKKGR